jgi:general stress protein YciG
VKLSAEARAALAEIGRKGGSATGPSKRRSKAHYERLAAMKRKKAKP